MIFQLIIGTADFKIIRIHSPVTIPRMNIEHMDIGVAKGHSFLVFASAGKLWKYRKAIRCHWNISLWYI